MSAKDSLELIRIYQEIEALTAEYRRNLKRAVKRVEDGRGDLTALQEGQNRRRELVREISLRKARLDQLANN